MAGEVPSFVLDSDVADTGVLTLTLTNRGDAPVRGFKLALNSLFRLKAESDLQGGTIVEQISNYQVIAPPDGLTLAPGASWSVTAARLSHALTHYNYGPKAAYLILSDGGLAAVAVNLMTRDGEHGAPLLGPRPRPALPVGSPPVSAVPFPAAIDVSGARAVSALSFAGGPREAEDAFGAVTRLAARLFPDDAPLFAPGGVPIVARAEHVEPEGYRLGFGANAVTVSASDRAGFFHAFVTLGQVLRGARLQPTEFVFPEVGTIADAPRFGFRGMHLDVARQFYGIDALHRFADCLAWLKLNRFHLHLTDDEGWRFEVPGYPELAEIAAWRGHGLAVPPLLGSGPRRHGGIYTRAELHGLVSHAGELGIVVVPEVDIPGHCYCVVKALPQLNDPDETGTYRSIQYFPNDALNPAVDATYDFLAAVLTELAEIFPSPWLHVGGDEVADDAWAGSPLARALMQDRGLTDVHGLQSYFLQRAQAIIRKLGRGVGAWEEATYGGGIDANGSYLVAWRKSESGLMLARQGYDVVLAPAERFYFDIAQSTEWWEPGAGWAGTVPPAATYAYDPGGDWPAEMWHRLIGVQGCLWSENMHERRLVDHMLFPRMPALAEVAWTAPEGKDFARFSAIEPLLFRTGERVGS